MQTTVQKKSALRSGNVLLEIGATFGALMNVGALRDVTFPNKGEIAEVNFDNARGIKRIINANKFSLDATLMEINWDAIKMMNGDAMTVENIAGTLVSGNAQVISSGDWGHDAVYELEGQNANGTAPTVNSVTGSVDGATSDFKLVKLPNGNWGIAIGDADLTSEAQDVTVNTDYTPTATKRVTIKESALQTEQKMRITNTNEETGKTTVYKLEGVANIEPINIDFPADEENDFASMPISLEGRLVEILDGQQTT